MVTRNLWGFPNFLDPINLETGRERVRQLRYGRGKSAEDEIEELHAVRQNAVANPVMVSNEELGKVVMQGQENP